MLVAVTAAVALGLAVAGCSTGGRDAARSSPSPAVPPAPPAAGGSTPTASTPAPAPPTPGVTAAPPVPAPAPSAAPGSAPSPPSAAAPPLPIPAGVRGVDWERLPTTRSVVALTFDAGANADAVPSILATLRARGVPATFFLTGDWVRRYPRAAREIAAAYPIGNHAMTHTDLTGLGDEQVRRQVVDAAAAITGTVGRDPRPLFRFPYGFPYGARTAHTITIVNDLGYVPVRWTVDSWGWKGTSGGMTAARVAGRVLGALRPGEIVLMHVGSNPDDHTTLDADALPAVIDGLKARGYGFLSLAELLPAGGG